MKRLSLWGPHPALMIKRSLKDEPGEYFQYCLPPNIPIEFILNGYSESLHKVLELSKFELLSRTTFFRNVLNGGSHKMMKRKCLMARIAAPSIIRSQ